MTSGNTVITAGLVLDILGVSILTWGLFISKESAAKLATAYYASDNIEDNLKLPHGVDRLKQRRAAIIGLPLLVLGFTLQIFGTWMAQPGIAREFIPTDGALYVIDETAGKIHFCIPLGIDIVCDRTTVTP